MNGLNSSLWNPDFTHIYVEERALNYKETQSILKRFPNAAVIHIRHYKDIFSRSSQNFVMQKKSQKLILAVKEESFLYQGAVVCQDFGNHHFYYTSAVMNCIYNCEYCYLQGMYPSGNLVVFVNLEDAFSETARLLRRHPVYLCVSYDTDLLGLEGVLGHSARWIGFAGAHPDLKIEIRTKSANYEPLRGLTPRDNVILAWTLSPEDIVRRYEHNTPSLHLRLAAIESALKAGWRVRLCFDPMIWHDNWKASYLEMVQAVFRRIPAEKVEDASVGVFRVSAAYLKPMRRQSPSSPVLQYPYEADHGVYHYKKSLSREMTGFLQDALSEFLSEDQIFLWSETETNET